MSKRTHTRLLKYIRTSKQVKKKKNKKMVLGKVLNWFQRFRCKMQLLRWRERCSGVEEEDEEDLLWTFFGTGAAKE